MSERLFVHDLDKWRRSQKAHEIGHAQVHTYKDALVLPIRKNPEMETPDGVYRGGGMLLGL